MSEELRGRAKNEAFSISDRMQETLQRVDRKKQEQSLVKERQDREQREFEQKLEELRETVLSALSEENPNFKNSELFLRDLDAVLAVARRKGSLSDVSWFIREMTNICQGNNEAIMRALFVAGHPITESQLRKHGDLRVQSPTFLDFYVVNDENPWERGANVVAFMTGNANHNGVSTERYLNALDSAFDKVVNKDGGLSFEDLNPEENPKK